MSFKTLFKTRLPAGSLPVLHIIRSSVFIILILPLTVSAQHTFSIVAFDSITGTVGGAGATCYDSVIDIADVHPGVGYIHTQSYVDYENQKYAHNLMAKGFTLKQIVDSLVKNDAIARPELRQYCMVDLKNREAFAFTGDSCFDNKGHRIGLDYAIAGNILAGSHVLDSMENVEFVYPQDPVEVLKKQMMN